MTQGVLRVNEIVVGTGFVAETQYNGMEGIVLEDLGVGMYVFSTDYENEIECHAYKIEWANGDETFSLRSNLKRKKPPSTDGKNGEEMIFDLFKYREEFLSECA